MNRIFYLLVFCVGLAVAAWVGAGYVGSNLLALAITALIVAAYSFGGVELLRFRQATATLDNALDNLPQGEPSRPAPQTLESWAAKLDPSLRDVVRLRVDGERVGLPGPSLTPYLVGLLVLLGMLGTFLGLVATLRGTGLALEQATDLQAIRASLAAPVKGLGFAFGTSVAGVAASAMLGLMAALARRDRIRVGRRLDAAIASTLHVFSKAHQRDESLKLMQQHAQALPVVAERLQTMLEALDKRALSIDEQLQQRSREADEQLQLRSKQVDDQFQQRSLDFVEQLQQRTSKLDETLEQKTTLLHQQLAERAAAQSQRLALEQESLHAKLTELYGGLSDTVQNLLTQNLEQTGKAVVAAVQPVVESTFASLSRESTALQNTIQMSVQQQLETLSGQFEQTTAKVADIWTHALAEHQHASESQLHAQKEISEVLIKEHQAAGQSLVEQQRSAGEALIQAQQRAGESLSTMVQGALNGFSETFERRSGAMLEGAAAQLDDVSRTLSNGWNEAFLQQQSANEEAADANRQLLSEAIAAFKQNSLVLMTQMEESDRERQAALAAQETERLHKWSESLDATLATLRIEWGALTRQTQEHAAGTLANIQQLVDTASEAPQMAADLIAQMREKLSDSLERDNAMLEERGRMLETLATLLDSVDHASSRQRTAVDQLLSNSSSLLDRIGTQVSDRVEAEAGKLGYMASQITGSAIQIAGLGDTFGKSVQSFAESNATLVEHLQRVEQALDKTLARSDEQLAYYVAQAREVVDLSMLSQKQILEELQQMQGALPNGGPEHKGSRKTKESVQLRNDLEPEGGAGA